MKKSFAVMHTISLIIVLVYLDILLATPSLWVPGVDPLPPLQPKEVGYSLTVRQSYTDLATGVSSLQVLSAYEYLSYSYLSTFSITSHGSSPIVQLAFNNYTNPYSETSTYVVEYNSRSCVYGPSEGYSPYMGYDYYQNQILDLYYSGQDLYFEYEESSYGLLLVYSSIVPYPGEYPRNITYTVAFENSTGYLVRYDLVGTEYCCPTNSDYSCPNSGLCNDGSVPTITLAQTNQTSFDYDILEASDWPADFFQYACPFNISTAAAEVSSSSSNDPITQLWAITATVLFGVTLLVLIGENVYLFSMKKSVPMASSKE